MSGVTISVDFGRFRSVSDTATTRGIGANRREAEEWSGSIAYGLDDQ